MASPLLLVADGDIPSTAITLVALRASECYGDVSMRLAIDLRLADVMQAPVLFSRVCAPELHWVPDWIVSRGGRYGYFLDDNLWDFRSDSPVGRYYARREVRAALDAFVARAAVVLVNSELLAGEVLARNPGANVAVVPAAFDFALAGPPAIDPGGPLRVGYAGSERGRAFAPAVAAIRRLLQERPGDFVFEFIGHVPEGLDRACITVLPTMASYAEFLAFKRNRGWHVGLAPLEDSAFARSKTNNKYREYGGLGIAGLYSDVEPYRSSVRHGETGLLVGPAASDWFAALTRLADDRSLLRRLGDNAMQDVWTRHRPAVVCQAWETALARADLATPSVRVADRVYWHARRSLAALGSRLAGYRTLARDEGANALAMHVLSRITRRA